MKKLMVFFILAWAGSVPALYAFWTPLPEEAYVDFLAAPVLGPDTWRFQVQHHYHNADISSMNFRLGYGLLPGWELNLSGLYHNIEFETAGQTLKQGDEELELMPAYALLASPDPDAWKLSVAAGFNEMYFHQQDATGKFKSETSSVSGQIRLEKTWAKTWVTQCTPMAYYQLQDQKAVMGLGLSAKWAITAGFGLVAEYPLLLANPYTWKNSWSAGIQFMLGPHWVTLFMSNTYGFTQTNMLQGLDRNYVGFRFSF